jgi:NAD(P)-dependent dehydrogenase (short-subunit alcohol dehydrogenase family)
MKLKNKVAIVTGAGSGIGRASSLLFAKEGAKVVVADIDEKAAKKVTDEIKSVGGEAIALKVDVSSGADAKKMIDTAVNTFGRLDILYNNAGFLGPAFDQTTEEIWRKVVDIDLTGPFLACMNAVPVMKEQGSGVILSTASEAGLKATGPHIAYHSAKGGVVMLTKSLAKTLAKDNIRVNCVCPGPTNTGITQEIMSKMPSDAARQEWLKNRGAQVPIGRSGEPEDIAAAALFLVSDDASFVTGVAFPVDGGRTA